MNEPETPQQPADPPISPPESPAETQSFGATMRGVWERIKHHKIVQWTLAYLAIAYTLLHGAEMLTGSLGWPHGWIRLFTLLLILGVPIVVTLAWYHGSRGQQSASGTEIMIIAIMLALGGAFLWRDSTDHGKAAEAVVATKPAPVVALPVAPVAPDDKSIAVLPFVSLSAGEADGYLADGLAESILHRLCEVPRLKVVARTSSFAFKNKSVDIRQIGELLGADAVLEGSVQRIGDRLRVVAQLIDTRNGTHLWSKSFDRSATDAFAIQDEIAQLIGETVSGRAIASTATPSTTRSASGADPRSAAFDQYLKGLSALSTDTVQNIERSIAYFRRAVTIDDGYVEAWVGLADAYLAAASAGIQPTQGLQNKAQAALDKAFALRPTFADAHRALGMLQISRDFQSSDARRSFEKALVLNPNLAAAHEGLAWLAVNSQEFAAARKHFELALQLNPYSRNTVLDSLVLDQVDGQFSGSLAKIRRLLWIDPTNADAYRAYAGVQRTWYGRLDDSIRYTRRAATLDPGKLVDVINLAQDELHLGRIAESKALAEKALGIAPEDAATYSLLAWIHLAERDEAAADEAWRRAKALTADGSNPDMHYSSWSLLRAGRARDALSQLQESGSHRCPAPLNSEYVLAMTPAVCGYLLLQVGETEQGKAVLHEALTALERFKLGSFDRICWEEAAILVSLGEKTRAIEALKRAVSAPRCRLSVQYLDNELFDPRFSTLRDNAEFQRILVRIHDDLDRMARDLDARPELNMEDFAADVPAMVETP